MSLYPESVGHQGLKALDTPDEVEGAIASRAKEVMVMLAAFGLVPDAAAA